MPTLLAFALPAFLLGLLLGSFLNVVISRLPAGGSVIRPRSRCPRCEHTIRWHDNIPLLSWLLLRRRCRDCGEPISWRYPAVELASGVWLALVAVRALPLLTPGLATEGVVAGVVSALGLATLGLLLIALIVIDWQHQLLPDALTLPGIAAGFFLVCIRAIFLGPAENQVILHRQINLNSPGAVNLGNVFMTGAEAVVGGRLFAICAAALLLLAIRWIYRALRGREGMGLGDVKLLAMIAALLGFWPAVLALFFGVLAASLVGTVLLLTRRAGAATRLPFGSFLGAGGLAVALWGPQIITWYRSLL